MVHHGGGHRARRGGHDRALEGRREVARRVDAGEGGLLVGVDANEALLVQGDAEPPHEVRLALGGRAKSTSRATRVPSSNSTASR